jgi:septal ring factor EnvC (AmiA/AmiB activator)
VKTPSEELDRIAAQLQRVAVRLRAAEDDAAMFTREDVASIVEGRLDRERRKRRGLERERDELQAEIVDLEAELVGLRGQRGSYAEDPVD